MKEINDIKESKAVNILIPEAIYQNNKLKKEIRQRIRLNKIFKEFENKASNELNYFISQSSQRYNNLKNGHNLKNLLINSKQKNIKEACKILEDPFYIDLDIEKEKQKMKIIKTKDLNKNISPLLSKMKQPETINLKNISTDFDDINRNNNNYDFEYYDINPNKKNNIYKEYINNIISNKKINKNYWSKKPTCVKGNKKHIKFNKDLNLMDKNKNYILKWFKREENLINKSFNNYKNILKNEEENYTISKKDISSNIIHLPKLKLLNYKSQNNINKNNENKDINKNVINYNYLLSFSDKSLYKQKNVCGTPKKEDKEDKKNNESFIPHLTEIDDISNQIEKYGNTLDIVVNSAKKELNKENDINYKRQKLEKIFGDNTPKAQLYDEILKRKSETIKNERRHKAIKIIGKQQYLGGNKKETLNLKIDNNVKLLDKVFKAIDMYNEKKH